MKVLHFADAHIDMANYGRHDAATGLPLRVLDFLKSLDTIIDTAISERVELVLFAGDAYKDRSPSPTYQREWGQRIMRLSRAGIPTLLLVGNHDISPASGRALSFQEFDTLDVPHVHILAKPELLGPDALEGLPLQVIALPWINRSAVEANLQVSPEPGLDAHRTVESAVIEWVQQLLDRLDPGLPAVLIAHGSVEGAVYGGERSVMLGSDFTLPRSLVRDTRLDYTALGHIHKMQDLNNGGHPPVIYPGSIERVDAGEAGDDKYFVLADIQKGATRLELRKLAGIRPFLTREVTLDGSRPVTEQLLQALEPQAGLAGAIVRLVAHFSRELQPQIELAALRKFAAAAFEFHFVPRPESDIRIRLPQSSGVAALGPVELSEAFWRESHLPEADIPFLKGMAEEIIREAREQEAVG